MRTKILLAGILAAWDVAAQPQTEQEQPVEIVVEVDETNVYRVDFQVPPDAPQGAASIQLAAAWIPGSVVTISVR